MQTFDIGPGVDVPILSTVLPSCEQVEVLVVTFHRAAKTFVVHIGPRRSSASGARVAAGRVPHRANTLVFRGMGLTNGYKDCCAEDVQLAEQAVDL